MKAMRPSDGPDAVPLPHEIPRSRSKYGRGYGRRTKHGRAVRYPTALVAYVRQYCDLCGGTLSVVEIARRKGVDQNWIRAVATGRIRADD